MNFESILRARGLKSTPQRSIILSQIYQAGHIDIEKLHAQVIKIIKIPLGTLYRALMELGNAGILTAISINGFKTHYEITKNSHAHTVCDKCGQICDVEYDSAKLTQNENFKNFHINSVQLIAHGVCNGCGK